jgi:hypothetical protein
MFRRAAAEDLQVDALSIKQDLQTRPRDGVDVVDDFYDIYAISNSGPSRDAYPGSGGSLLLKFRPAVRAQFRPESGYRIRLLL